MISFKEFYLLEGLNTKEEVFWQTIYHKMWWDHIQRAVPNESNLTQGHKNIIKRTKPAFVVTGPKMSVEFYQVTKVDIKTGEHKTADTLIMKENRGGMGYPDSYYIINDYDIRSVIEWWEENWNFLLKGPDEDEGGYYGDVV